MTQYELIKNVAKYGFKAFGLTLTCSDMTSSDAVLNIQVA